MRKGSKSYIFAVKAKEGMLAAVEIFNSPLITFKSETTITLVCTAWTYLLQAHCLEASREIRQLEPRKSRRKFARSKEGEYLTLPLPDLMDVCPDILSEPTKKNLQFLIGVRNRIQHYAGHEIDSLIAPKIQANILSFKEALKTVSVNLITIENELPYALQFSELSLQQTKQLLTKGKSSSSLKTFILEFEGKLTPELRQSPEYQARVKLQVINRERGEDLQYVEVLGIGKESPDSVSTTYLKEVEKTKHTATEVIEMMEAEGFVGFRMKNHTDLWKSRDGKNPKYGYCYELAGRCFWYDKWINEVVRPFCKENHITPPEQKDPK